MVSLILTLIGPDRPGLVDTVAHLVTENSGNWAESRMAHLAGFFAGIVRVEIAPEAAEALITSLETLSGDGLSVTVRRDDSTLQEAEERFVRLELVGNDRTGIVRDVTHVLADAGVNVEEFHTECTGAPNSGAQLFRAQASLRLPAELPIGSLQASLEEIALDLMVDIQLATESAL